ncbi:MAG: hypothetical protein GWO81_00900 [Verrucomicrobia bacterium]|nr:hypothetical protein [Verrucomicrobiota bacterium]
MPPLTSIDPKLRRICLAILLSVGLLTVACAFGIVWMQQEISRTAANAARLESQLAQKVDKLRYLDGKISRIHQPVVLQGKVSGRLRPAEDLQVVWVAERNGIEGRVYADAISTTPSGLAFIFEPNTSP